MLDASYYTASPADRDIIYIRPELPFILIGASGGREGERLQETNRVKETRGGDRGRIETRGRVMGRKQEQLVKGGERQRLVSGSERGETRRVLAGIKEEESQGKVGWGRSRILFHFKALLALRCDTILTFLISLHLSFSDPHLFSFLYFSSCICFSVFPLFLFQNRTYSTKSARLLLSCTPSIMWHKQLCQRGSSFVICCPHFIRPLSQLSLSLLLVPCSHNTLLCSTTVMCCKVIIATSTRETVFKARTKW